MAKNKNKEEKAKREAENQKFSQRAARAEPKKGKKGKYGRGAATGLTPDYLDKSKRAKAKGKVTRAGYKKGSVNHARQTARALGVKTSRGPDHK